MDTVREIGFRGILQRSARNSREWTDGLLRYALQIRVYNIGECCRSVVATLARFVKCIGQFSAITHQRKDCMNLLGKTAYSLTPLLAQWCREQRD